MGLLNGLLRAGEGRELRDLSKFAAQVEQLDEVTASLSDEELREETTRLRALIAGGATLDSVAVEAFAAVREAAHRTLGMKAYPVQIMGGYALHRGRIADIKTGEGKSLVATLPAYLGALSGDGVHVVTVNDYLASYQADLMKRVFAALGMTTGVITSELSPTQRQRQYACDVTYGTSTQFGFDYLRDNMVSRSADRVQRGHGFAVVDEVDSILIDEARTPLLISGPASGPVSPWFRTFALLVERMRRGTHYEVDEKKRTAGLLEPGIDLVEDELGAENLYDASSAHLVGLLNNAVKAKELFTRDKDYVVARGAVDIVDQNTGRILTGRRYNDGLHQAIEAKEGVEIKPENQTMATITLQNYFKLYTRLSGMTGTAESEAAEFMGTYGIRVVPIPTNRPKQRIDQSDLIYLTERAKFEAVADDIEERHRTGQPVLVGTTSVEKSERLGRMLTERGVRHHVLNAKNHEREAAIVAMAGAKGAVTVATNMAGRGTDIMLGGNTEFMAHSVLEKRGLDPIRDAAEYESAWDELLAEAKAWVRAEREEVDALGGLYVIGTERHDSRRIDNQLRGRSGRQGDPGESRFYLSLEDDIARMFGGGGTVQAIMARSGLGEDVPLTGRLISRTIERAQSDAESRNTETRKNVLKYDDVLTKQRARIYEERRRVLDESDLSEHVHAFRERIVRTAVRAAVGRQPMEDVDLPELWNVLGSVFPLSITPQEMLEEVGGAENLTEKRLADELTSDAKLAYGRLESALGDGGMRQLERAALLASIDKHWREHLYEMDYLKEGIGLRAIAQKDPLVEYAREAKLMFDAMVEGIWEDVVASIFRSGRSRASAQAQEAAVMSTQLGRKVEVPGAVAALLTQVQTMVPVGA
ncbi:preprotein translocase subunit SecA [Brachybacterium sp. JHP9]|uniref:Protein translocase subunit SecA n=1 Tax=Brachybacterium equifaecis TaxID=2910770 RepID=A0ABT0R189_9MICO|nr:preprotein translocase subunit SecA [Brachybacterium equifaecis]MCL6423690.1 preprotein translocase subunit SecA [Brachybacterium equifaecis]